jgi:tetratricopeptide (TPR) repeat protein
MGCAAGGGTLKEAPLVFEPSPFSSLSSGFGLVNKQHRTRKQAASPKMPPRRPLSVRKKLLFAGVTIAGLFAVLEAALWLWGVRPLALEQDPFVGFASTLPLYVSDPQQSGMLVTAENKRELFNTQRFARHKPSGTYRVFCLGGSTTYGHPYDDRASFAAWLRELLPCADASRRWEVINAGGISYASYRVAALMQELVAYEPDLFVIYTGHNEFLEHRTYKNFFELPLAVREASAVLSRTRTYTLLRRMLVSSPHGQAAAGRQQLPAEVDARLDHTIGPADYHRDESTRRQIVEHLRFNLRRMVDLAHAAGAEVVFVTPAANLKDCSPFKSEHREDLSESELSHWSSAYHEARRRQKASEWPAAVERFEEALTVDDRYAELHYRLGQCLLNLGQLQEANRAFERARDEDICPLRAPAKVIEAVHEAVQAKDCGLVDFASQVGKWSVEQSGQESPGREMFLDHVHLSQELTGRLARLIVDQMARQGIVAAGPKPGCLAEATELIASQLDSRELGVGMRNIAKVYSWAGKMEEAGPAALAALERLPDDRESLFIAGAYLKQNGRSEEGTEYYRRALELEVEEHPDDVEARQFLAKACAEQGMLAAAQRHYEIALKLRPASIEAHFGLAQVLLRLGQRAAARRQLVETLKLKPDHREARAALEQLDGNSPDE